MSPRAKTRSSSKRAPSSSKKESENALKRKGSDKSDTIPREISTSPSSSSSSRKKKKHEKAPKRKGSNKTDTIPPVPVKFEDIYGGHYSPEDPVTGNGEAKIKVEAKIKDEGEDTKVGMCPPIVGRYRDNASEDDDNDEDSLCEVASPPAASLKRPTKKQRDQKRNSDRSKKALSHSSPAASSKRPTKRKKRDDDCPSDVPDPQGNDSNDDHSSPAAYSKRPSKKKKRDDDSALQGSDNEDNSEPQSEDDDDDDDDYIGADDDDDEYDADDYDEDDEDDDVADRSKKSKKRAKIVASPSSAASKTSSKKQRDQERRSNNAKKSPKKSKYARRPVPPSESDYCIPPNFQGKLHFVSDSNYRVPNTGFLQVQIVSRLLDFWKSFVKEMSIHGYKTVLVDGRYVVKEIGWMNHARLIAALMAIHTGERNYVHNDECLYSKPYICDYHSVWHPCVRDWTMNLLREMRKVFWFTNENETIRQFCRTFRVGVFWQGWKSNFIKRPFWYSRDHLFQTSKSFGFPSFIKKYLLCMCVRITDHAYLVPENHRPRLKITRVANKCIRTILLDEYVREPANDGSNENNEVVSIDDEEDL